MAARAPLVILASAMIAGCALISGASDLEVGPLSASPAAADAALTDARDDRANAVDAAADVAVDAAAVDARVDAGPTRIRDVTFESGSLMGPDGVDRVQGGAVLRTGSPLDGMASADVKKDGLVPAILGVDFPNAEPELFVSLLFRLDANLGKTAVFLRMTLAAPGDTVTVGLVDGRLALTAGKAVLGTSDRLLNGTVYRLALHVREGAGNAVVQASLAPNKVADATFASSAVQTLGRTTAIDLGQIDSLEIEPALDNLRLDRALPPPP
jgi:hypothetical protein